MYIGIENSSFDFMIRFFPLLVQKHIEYRKYSDERCMKFKFNVRYF